MTTSWCNKCNLEDMKKRHKGLKVINDPRPGFPDGKKVLDKDGEFLAWFASVPKHCAC